MSDFPQWLPSLLSALAAGVTAFVGAWIAPRRFRSERWFDRKAETYSAIFDALNEMAEEFDHLIGAEEKPLYVVTPEFATALAEASALARTKLRKIARVGSFTISKESEVIVAKLLADLETYLPDAMWSERMNVRAIAIQNCSEKLKIAARADLKLS